MTPFGATSVQPSLQQLLKRERKEGKRMNESMVS
jgi:hypothetical protein